MGGSVYDKDADDARVHHNKSTGSNNFVHHAKVTSGTASALHPSMDIRNKKRREARDSKEHPISIPIVVFFDQTGSMGTVPKILVDKLPTIMTLLLKEGYVPNGDPAILYGCIGDAHNGERAPLQVGEFESGNEMVDSFANMFLEGSGGGNGGESYDLALYVAARKFEMDHLEKRGEKGYMFIIGDEPYFPVVKAEQILNHVGDLLKDDVSIEQIFKEASEKFEIFFIMPKTGYWNYRDVQEAWKKLVSPERFLRLEDPSLVAELIASTIGMMEGIAADRLRDNLRKTGANSGAIDMVTKSLAVVKPPTGMQKAGTADLPDIPKGPPGIKKL